MRIVLLCLLLIPLWGFHCGKLHYSKLNFYRDVFVSKIDSNNHYSGNVTYSISNMYSCIFKGKYYVQFNVDIDNRSRDSVFYYKGNTMIDIKGYSFSLADNYTMIDEKGRKHSFQTYKNSPKKIIAPGSQIGINFNFFSVKKINEKIYKNSFLHDTVFVRVKVPEQGRNFEFRFIGNSHYKSQ